MNDFYPYNEDYLKIIGVESKESEQQKAFLRKHKTLHRMIMITRLLLLLLFLILWEVAARKLWIDPFFFSSPSAIISYIYSTICDLSFFEHTGITLLEVILSFSIVTILSILLAMLFWYNHFLSSVLEPFLVVLNSLPKSALAPLLIVWLGTGVDTIIIAGISVAIFGAIINLYTGFSQTDPELIKLIQTLGGTRFQILKEVVLPYNLPLILSNMKVNIGLSLVGVIIGEFLAARRGLGYLIIYGSQIFKLDMLIASIVILCMIAVLFYLILQAVDHRKKKGSI